MFLLSLLVEAKGLQCVIGRLSREEYERLM
jgi:hypothetical protein